MIVVYEINLWIVYKGVNFTQVTPQLLTHRQADFCLFSITGSSSAGIKFTQLAILRVFRSTGATRSTDDSEIWHMVSSVVPNFTFIGPYLGVSGQINTKNREIWVAYAMFPSV